MERRIRIALLIFIISSLAFGGTLFLQSCGKKSISRNTPAPTAATPSNAPAQTPESTGTPSPTPSQTQEPLKDANVRTDYENFKPNEVGEIPIVMFHKFLEAYEPDTEKEYTSTFAEFEALLQTLYDKGFRLISMQDFIDMRIDVPAGTMPMVFTFDDGTPSQFSLIEENGGLKVNPRSAVGIMMEFGKKHPDFGLEGIFYVNMDIGDNTFKGAGTLRERFEFLESLGLEIGSHTWGHVDYKSLKTKEKIVESIGRNQEKAEELLPGLRFYSLALPYGSRPEDESLWPYLIEGTYNNIDYHHETVMAVGANPSVPPISKEYNSAYVRRIRAQGRVAVDADLTWWLPKMTPGRMFVSDGDPGTIVVPLDKKERVDELKLNGKSLITY